MKEFKEVQRFNQWWLWILLAGVTIFLIFGIIIDFIVNEPLPEDEVSSWILVIILLFPILLMYLFYKIRLIIKINEEGVHFRWSIFLKDFITYNWEDIQSVEIIKYQFVGYGMRLSIKYGIVHNTSGNMGLFLKLKNGNKRMLGTNKPQQLEEFIRNLQKENIQFSEHK